MKKKRKGPVIEITESPYYRPVNASGVFGGLNPDDGKVIFFLDRVKPKMKRNPPGAMDTEKINRELQVEVHMSPSQFTAMAKWMMEHVNRLERAKKGKRVRGEASEASYIG